MPTSTAKETIAISSETTAEQLRSNIQALGRLANLDNLVLDFSFPDATDTELNSDMVTMIPIAEERSLAHIPLTTYRDLALAALRNSIDTDIATLAWSKLDDMARGQDNQITYRQVRQYILTRPPGYIEWKPQIIGLYPATMPQLAATAALKRLGSLDDIDAAVLLGLASRDLYRPPADETAADEATRELRAWKTEDVPIANTPSSLYELPISDRVRYILRAQDITTIQALIDRPADKERPPSLSHTEWRDLSESLPTSLRQIANLTQSRVVNPFITAKDAYDARHSSSTLQDTQPAS